MGRCGCGKKDCKNSTVCKKACKSKNKSKIKENNNNNAFIVNVDQVPEQAQQNSALNAANQEALANSGQMGTEQSQIGNNLGPFAPNQGFIPQAAAAPVLGGISADEIRNLLKGATDYAAEAAGQAGQQFPEAYGGGCGGGCGCGKKKCKASNKRSKKTNKQKSIQKSKNNKINVNLAVLLTRSTQTPVLTTTQLASNESLLSPVTGPLDLGVEEGAPIPGDQE